MISGLDRTSEGMPMKHLLASMTAAIVLSLASAAGAEDAQPLTGENLLLDFNADAVARATAINYVLGILDTLILIEHICPPEETMTMGEAAETVILTLEANRHLREAEIPAAAIAAARRSFPC
ncbi:Rap1a/Tai family immunity protein [Fodinicurvata sediminis]|uniref:Rap1a/Tai family immunity protein n=1 Tax=Fodinicurvata sediminis TaxID=1121832 RepID=UPI0003B3DEA1|nr:Rap1a/Tai family immunity protein [Fodinicurvata sediminis]